MSPVFFTEKIPEEGDNPGPETAHQKQGGQEEANKQLQEIASDAGVDIAVSGTRKKNKQ